MKHLLYISILFLAKITLAQTACYTASNSIGFNYNGHSYKIIKELKNWSNAATCAVSDGGYLVEIADATEQNAVYNALTTSGISTTYKAISDGGGTSYVWIGATDNTTEGTWLWDGDNNGAGTNFWNGQGQAGTGAGTVVAAAYNNWGQTNGSGPNNEPDNYTNVQDAGAIALTGWPSGGTSYGAPGQWNDINPINTCYYIIEYNTILTTVLEQNNETQIFLFPNPVKDFVEINTLIDIKELALLSIDGKLIKTLASSKTIDLTGLGKGIYFLQITTAENKIITKKIVKD